MTPELPRAPRSRAEAVDWRPPAPASWRAPCLRAPAAAVPMVMDILVPVSPSGTGNTFRSLMACFWAVMAAAPWSTICLKTAPRRYCCIMARLFPSLRHGQQCMESTQTFTSRTVDAGVLGDHIAHLAHDGAADSGQVDAVFHDDVQLDGDGVVFVIGDLDALAHGLPPQQVDQTVGHGAVRPCP